MITLSPVGALTGWQVADPTLVKNWDRWLAEREDATFFHTSAWAAVLKEAYGYRPLYLIKEGFGRPPSILPLMEVNSAITGKRGVSLPFTDTCLAIGDSSEDCDELLQKACELGRERCWRYVELRGGRQKYPGAEPSVCFYTHLVRLDAESDKTLQNCHSSVRRAIRKAQQMGVETEIAHNLEAINVFYDLHCLTRRRHGIPPQPFSFFASIHRQVIATGKGFVAMARRGRQVIAAGIFFHFAGKAIYKFGASSPVAKLYRGNNAMMWSAILQCIQNGCQTLDLGRTSYGNPGLRRFKLGWGAEESVLDYLRFDLKRDEFIKGNDRAVGWHNRFIRLLPVPVARSIGEAMYPHLA